MPTGARVRPVGLDPRVQLATRETPVKRGLKETMDLLVILESRALLGRLARRDRQELRAMWARLAKPARLVPQDLAEFRALLGRQGIRVPRVLRDLKAPRGSKE